MIKNDLRKRVYKIKNPPLTIPTTDLQGEGVKVIIPSKVTDIYTRLEILVGLKLSVHTNNLTGASNIIDDLCKRGEFQNDSQYRNAPNNFHIKILTIIFVLIRGNMFNYKSIFTFIKNYVTYEYTSIYTRVCFQFYNMDTYNYIYNYTRDICIYLSVLIYTFILLKSLILRSSVILNIRGVSEQYHILFKT